MAIRNIIQKAEQEFPPSIKQESDPVAMPELALLSGYINSTTSNIVFTTGDQTISGNKTFSAQQYVFSGANVIFVDNTGVVSGAWQFASRPTINGTGVLLQGEAADGSIENVVYTTGDQTISGNKTFQANEYNFDGADISIYGGGTFEVNASVETKGIPKNLGGVSGLQVMTTGAYNSGIPLSGVVYILI